MIYIITDLIDGSMTHTELELLSSLKVPTEPDTHVQVISREDFVTRMSNGDITPDDRCFLWQIRRVNKTVNLPLD